MERAHVRYIVDDVDVVIDFYRSALGFEVDMHPAPGFAALTRGELTLLLNAPGAGGAGERVKEGSPKPGGWNRIQIEVDDLQSFHDKLLHGGLHFRGDIVRGRGGAQALLEDPAGNPIELFEPKRSRPSAVPRGFRTVTPFLPVADVETLIAFAERTFDAKVSHRMRSDDGVTRHATVAIGDSMLMLSRGVELYGKRPATLHLYLGDVDQANARGLEAGATSLEAPHDEFYGDRRAGVADAWDDHWWLATHIEDVDPETLKEREQRFREQRAR